MYDTFHEVSEKYISFDIRGRAAGVFIFFVVVDFVISVKDQMLSTFIINDCILASYRVRKAPTISHTRFPPMGQWDPILRLLWARYPGDLIEAPIHQVSFIIEWITDSIFFEFKAPYKLK